MTEFFKATRPDGTDFHTGTIYYAAALVSGEVIRHPAARMKRDDAATYLSVSTSTADCAGFEWPCRLFRVEPVGRVMGGGKVPLKVSPNKRACQALRVVEELPAWQAFGPNGEAVVALIERAGRLSADEVARLTALVEARDAAWDAALAGTAARNAARAAAWTARLAAWDAARLAAQDATADAAWDAVWVAVWVAARDATWDAARRKERDAVRDAAWDAAWALLVRDLITPEHCAILTKPWRDAGLPL